DLNLASQYTSRLILLHKGKVFAQGGPREIINEKNIWKVYGVKVKVISEKKGNPLVNLWPTTSRT
ncbi:MAG: ABC transporter, partial [Candidatus Aminicenantes bacterium]|nr:ABC transporter [Candidatus Aminicenantes bacterium]